MNDNLNPVQTAQPVVNQPTDTVAVAPVADVVATPVVEPVTLPEIQVPAVETSPVMQPATNEVATNETQQVGPAPVELPQQVQAPTNNVNVAPTAVENTQA